MMMIVIGMINTMTMIAITKIHKMITIMIIMIMVYHEANNDGGLWLQ